MEKPVSVNSIPISDRKTTCSKLYVYAFTGLLAIILTLMHISQLVLLPFSFVPGGLREGYWWYIRNSEQSFARVLTYLAGRGGSNTLEISVDDSIDLKELVGTDEDGTLLLKFDRRAVWISNHQGYCDWVYLYILFLFSDLASGTVIVLKKSIENVPVVAGACKLWKFLFLSTWTEDRTAIGKSLQEIGTRASEHERPLALLIYPEGTLVSRITRPISKAYADASGIEDLKHLLLPRSTGLFFCLRTLQSVTPDLSLYDVTFGYPDLPSTGGYVQSYYTLRSVLVCQQAPSSAHLHIRRYPLDQVPLGSIDPLLKLNPNESCDSATSQEKEAFNLWLRQRWIEKDELMDGFYKTGRFEGGDKEGKSVSVKIELKFDDWLSIASNLAPLWLLYLFIKYSYRYALMFSEYYY